MNSLSLFLPIFPVIESMGDATVARIVLRQCAGERWLDRRIFFCGDGEPARTGATTLIKERAS